MSMQRKMCLFIFKAFVLTFVAGIICPVFASSSCTFSLEAVVFAYRLLLCSAHFWWSLPQQWTELRGHIVCCCFTIKALNFNSIWRQFIIQMIYLHEALCLSHFFLSWETSLGFLKIFLKSTFTKINFKCNQVTANHGQLLVNIVFKVPSNTHHSVLKYHPVCCGFTKPLRVLCFLPLLCWCAVIFVLCPHTCFFTDIFFLQLLLQCWKFLLFYCLLAYCSNYLSVLKKHIDSTSWAKINSGFSWPQNHKAMSVLSFVWVCFGLALVFWGVVCLNYFYSVWLLPPVKSAFFHDRRGLVLS